MDDRDNTQPELPALHAGSLHALPRKTMPEETGKAAKPAQLGEPESGYDPYNSAV
jgi:hypothetical protein